MEASVPVSELQLAPPRYVAPLWHTIVLVLFLLIFSALGREGHPGLDHHARMKLYSLTIVLEWTMVAFIIWGLYRYKHTRLRDLIGGRWSKPEDFLLDVVVAVGFLFVSFATLGLIGYLLGLGNPSSAKDSLKEMQHRVGSMLPVGGLEIFIWVLLSSTAGFCEEVIYRGYFQRQIAGLFNSAWAGIVLQGMIFGGSHAYEGWAKMVQIGVFGILFGILAHWRKSLRPGMIGHAAFDIFQGIVGGYVLRNADKLLKK